MGLLSELKAMFMSFPLNTIQTLKAITSTYSSVRFMSMTRDCETEKVCLHPVESKRDIKIV